MCGGRKALRVRLERLAEAAPSPQASSLANELGLAEQRLEELETELKTVSRNLARSADDAVFAAIKAEYKEKEAETGRVRQQVDRLRGRTAASPATTPEQEVTAALNLVDEIERITGDPSARAEIPQLLRKLSLNLWLGFGDTQKGSTSIRVVRSGLLTIGSGPRPRCFVGGSGDRQPDAGGGEDMTSPPLCGDNLR